MFKITKEIKLLFWLIAILLTGIIWGQWNYSTRQQNEKKINDARTRGALDELYVKRSRSDSVGWNKLDKILSKQDSILNLLRVGFFITSTVALKGIC